MDTLNQYTNHKFILFFRRCLNGGLPLLTEKMDSPISVQQFSRTEPDTIVAGGLLVR